MDTNQTITNVLLKNPRALKAVELKAIHGLSNKQIALKMNISTGTVKGHFQALRNKTGKTTEQIIYISAKEGII